MRLLSMLMAALGGPFSPAADWAAVQSVRLSLPGWVEEKPDEGMRFWRNAAGDLLSLTVPDAATARDFLDSSEVGLRRAARELAESRGGGLIEAAQTAGPRPRARLIYKRLEKPAYIYTGMLVVRARQTTLIWTVVSGERGMTGVREATLTAEMFSSGALTMDGFERSWARDPYDPDYKGVDGSVLRFLSDDERYDERFPEHPLSKVRRVLAALPDSITGQR